MSPRIFMLKNFIKKYIYAHFPNALVFKVNNVKSRFLICNNFSIYIVYIVCKGFPTPQFLRHPPLALACTLFKIIAFPLLFSIPSALKVFQTVPPHPHAGNSSPALIRQTNLPYA